MNENHDFDSGTQSNAKDYILLDRIQPQHVRASLVRLIPMHRNSQHLHPYRELWLASMHVTKNIFYRLFTFHDLNVISNLVEMGKKVQENIRTPVFKSTVNQLGMNTF